MSSRSVLCALLLIAALLAGCATSSVPGGKGSGRLEGSVLYRERIALPPTAAVTVRLEDVALADAPATVIAETRFVPEGGPPYAFALDYDPARLDRRGVHVVRARIEVDGRLWFTNTERIPAFERKDGKPLVILVKRTARAPEAEPVVPDAGALAGTRWVLAEIDGSAAGPGADGQKPDLRFGMAGEATGFAGCNRFGGSVTVEGNRLTFGPLRSTMMACADGDAVEQAYLKKLVGTVRFGFEGRELLLFGEDDKRPLLRFRTE